MRKYAREEVDKNIVARIDKEIDGLHTDLTQIIPYMRGEFTTVLS
jgi:hypothetical protein